MTEAQLADAVRDLCGYYGVRHYHTYDSRRSPAGFPDLVMAGPGGLLFRELKSAVGRISQAQQGWIRALAQAGADVHVWRPEDLDSGRITREIKGIS